MPLLTKQTRKNRKPSRTAWMIASNPQKSRKPPLGPFCSISFVSARPDLVAPWEVPEPLTVDEPGIVGSSYIPQSEVDDMNSKASLLFTMLTATITTTSRIPSVRFYWIRQSTQLLARNIQSYELGRLLRQTGPPRYVFASSRDSRGPFLSP